MAEMSGQAVTGIRTGVIMDPIGGINIKKDSTFAMLLESQRRGHETKPTRRGSVSDHASAGNSEQERPAQGE